MLTTRSLSGDLVVFVTIFVAILTTYFHWTYRYWSRRNAQYLKPKIPYGNVSDGVKGKEAFGYAVAKIYREMKKKGWKHGGIFLFTNPCYFILDLDTIKNVLVKDSHYFTDRRGYYYNKDDPLQQHIINLNGCAWKNLRSKTTPLFSSGKIKMLFRSMIEIVDIMHTEIDNEILKNDSISIDKIVLGFSSKIISFAFGADLSRSGDRVAYLVEILGKKILSGVEGYSIKRNFALLFPKIAKLLNISLVDKEAANVIVKYIHSIIKTKANNNNNHTANDLMQSLINIKNKKGMTLNEMESQCALLMAVGVESISNTLMFAIYEIAKHQDVQEKLREEINEMLAQHDDKITYESVKSMEYMNQVIDECLRLHPGLPQFSRICVKDYKIPGEDLVIKKGTQILISTMGIHHDKDYYPDPTQFDPSRFEKEERSRRHEFAFMPFGKGPRSCIAKHLGYLLVKLGLITFMRNYKFSFNSETLDPIVYKPKNVSLKMQKELWLKVEKV